MEKLAKTCKILYDHDLLETNRELRKYRAKYDIPKIVISCGDFFHQSRDAKDMLDDSNNNLVTNVENALKHVYQEKYKKYELFFQEQLKQLNENILILRDMVDWWRNDDYIEEYDFTWHFLNRLFEKVNWMYCDGCQELVQTCIGLCNECDQLRSPEPHEDIYMDNQDMLADAIEH
jgi:hypothetical protein